MGQPLQLLPAKETSLSEGVILKVELAPIAPHASAEQDMLLQPKPWFLTGELVEGSRRQAVGPIGSFHDIDESALRAAYEWALQSYHPGRRAEVKSFESLVWRDVEFG